MKSEVRIPTLWQAMSSSSRDLMAAQSVGPAVLVIIYGVFNLFDEKKFYGNFSTTTLPIIGGILSAFCIIIYSRIAESDKKGFPSSIGSLLGMIPYAFSLYVIFYLGGFGLWKSVPSFEFWGIAKGLFWMIVGYRMLRKFWIMTELSVLLLSQPDLAEVLFLKLGIKPSELSSLLKDIDGGMKISDGSDV